VGIRIDVTEVIALNRRIAGAGGRVGLRAAAALRKTAYDIEADAKALAPVDTGNLRSSIETRVSGDGRSASMTAEVSANAGYSAYVEFGTSTSPGQPFMGPAFDRRAPLFDQALGKIAEEAVLDD
jgi:HK97 gp10 family phage protein